MNKKSIKTLATGAAIATAIGATSVPAFAEEVTPTVETNTDTVVSATETTAVEAPKTSANVKPALDAQQAVVDATAAEASQAQADADAANQAVTTAEAEVATATEAVKDAEENLANATPENIAANQADQTANLADQTANATETDEVNAEIASQTQTVADAQVAVDTAQAEKDQADSAVTAAETDVKSAQDALSGTGLAEAQTNLDTASKAVTDAKANVDTATQAVEDAKKADAKRQEAIDAATTDVSVKTDAVETASSRVTAAQNNVASTTEALAKANDAVTAATDALKNVDTLTISGPIEEFKNKLKEHHTVKSKIMFDSQSHTPDELTELEAKKERLSAELTAMGAEIYNSYKLELAPNDEPFDPNNLTYEQRLELSLFAAQIMNTLREKAGMTDHVVVSKRAIDEAQRQSDLHVEHYRTYNKAFRSHKPLLSGYGENIGTWFLNVNKNATMNTAKRIITNLILSETFEDANSYWGHTGNLIGGYEVQVDRKGNPISEEKFIGLEIGISMEQIGGQINKHTVFTNDRGLDYLPDTDPSKVNNIIYQVPSTSSLQATLEKAKADQAAAQTALTNAQTALTTASNQYATVLAAKTAAEKTLANATATPLQTQVAENNLRLATIALQNAETRKVEAQKAVDNFSATLADKKAALDTAKANLETAQATATEKATTLETAKANLATQQATLDSLNKDKDALLAEKDRLVEEAKALATELKGYLDAPARLADAQTTLTEKQAALTEAQAKAETAQEKLETVTAKLAAEKAKLAELQAEYDKLKDLEDKAKDNVIATLPDGTIVAVPKDAPTAAEKPGVDVDAIKQTLDKGQDVKVVDGKVVVTNPQAGVTVTPQGITYSRAERAKTLPNTGEQTSLLALAGVTALSSLGLASARRRKQG
ncbi:SEC10/PgrA surface exclusion domain-containing protein [Streptococcus suis]|nr:SEC10/PgrA surface exclusion domain-containing protein [Streptococcus suis]